MSLQYRNRSYIIVCATSQVMNSCFFLYFLWLMMIVSNYQSNISMGNVYSGRILLFRHTTDWWRFRYHWTWVLYFFLARLILIARLYNNLHCPDGYNKWNSVHSWNLTKLRDLMFLSNLTGLIRIWLNFCSFCALFSLKKIFWWATASFLIGRRRSWAGPSPIVSIFDFSLKFLS